MAPRLVVLSLASDFGCQVQLTNMTGEILDVLGLVDLTYWQLATSGQMPDDYDVAIIEGAVTTAEHEDLLKRVRDTAAVVIVIGACANIGGIPAMATFGDLEDRYVGVYGADCAPVAAGRIVPKPVDVVIDVDYHVPGCPIDPAEFLLVLSRVLQGLKDCVSDRTMCASCKLNETVCFFDQGLVCLGLVTRDGCGARCPSLGRPCTGCRGVASDANLASARDILAKYGQDPDELDRVLRIYSAAKEVRA
jgi:sulfhydrogenase subunit delta